MAIFTTSAGIEDLTGKLNQTDRIVMRQKTFRLPNGKIIKRGPKEAFARDKRDYKRSPRTPAEQVQRDKWAAELCNKPLARHRIALTVRLTEPSLV